MDFDDNSDLEWTDELVEFYNSLPNTGKLVYLYDITVGENEEMDEDIDEMFNKYYEEAVGREYYTDPKVLDIDGEYRIYGKEDFLIFNYEDSVDYRKILRPVLMNGLILGKVSPTEWMSKVKFFENVLKYSNTKMYKVLHPQSLVMSVN